MDEPDAQKQPYWPELEELAKPAREHRRLAPETRGQIIIRLCRRAPLSVKDLSVLLDRSEAYIGDAIRPLVTAGELTFLYPEQPRHPRQKYMAASEINVDLSGAEEAVPLDIPQGYLAPPSRQERSREDSAVRGAPSAPPFPSPPVRQMPPEEPPRFPNQVVNLVLALLAGVILGLTAPALWWLIAIAVSFVLSFWHRLANSGQYRHFGTLDAFPSDAAFILLKSLVTFVEIAVVFLAIRAITGR